MSGRKFMSIAFTVTYCLCILGSLILTVIKVLDVKVFLALLTGFAPMVLHINNAYFSRDRTKEENNVIQKNPS